MDSGVDGGQLMVDSGADGGQWTVDGGRWTWDSTDGGHGMGDGG